MFGISWNEYILIAIVALIVIGPKELPRVLRAIGQWTAMVRRMAAEFQGQFHEALREAEMADLKQTMDNLNATAQGFTSGFDDPTKWEPTPESKPEIKPEATSESGKPDEAAKLSGASAPTPEGAGPTVESAAPAASEHPVPEMAGASSATAAPSEGSAPKAGDGGVHAS
jgi:sec-independent protein translocase protein TatB